MKHKYKETIRKSRVLGTSLFLTKIVSFFNRKRIITLTDFQGDIYYTFPRFGCACGKTHCNVYWGTKVGDVILNEDGIIDKDSEAFYMSSWKYFKGEK